MARYKPQKAKLVARDDTKKDKTAKDAVISWLLAHSMSHGDTTKLDTVAELATQHNLDFYQMQHKIYLASMLPQIMDNADPLDRLVYLLEDSAVANLAQRRLKAAMPSFSHSQSVSLYKSAFPVICEITGDKDHTDYPIATQMVCILAGKELLLEVSQGLSFSPDINDLATRIQQTPMRRSSSLYPVVSKDKQFTALDYHKKENKYSIPKKTDFYDVGEKVSHTMSEEFLDMDEEASDLIMQGYNLKDVVRFHNQAPQGYWDKVAKLMDDETMDFDQVYDKLEAEFNFHPDNRELI